MAKSEKIEIGHVEKLGTSSIDQNLLVRIEKKKGTLFSA